MSFILTHTGRFAGLFEPPSLSDIGLGLSRQPRFSGQGRHWWSVLDHSLFCHALGLREEYTASQQLAVLLHDAHEALTGDIPTPFKTDDMRALQGKLDAVIFAAYHPGGLAEYKSVARFVHDVDKRAMLAEALVVGPVGFAALPPAAFAGMMGGKAKTADVSFLREEVTAGRLSRPYLLDRGADAQNVRAFVQTCTNLAEASRRELFPPTSDKRRAAVRG